MRLTLQSAITEELAGRGPHGRHVRGLLLVAKQIVWAWMGDVDDDDERSTCHDCGFPRDPRPSEEGCRCAERYKRDVENGYYGGL